MNKPLVIGITDCLKYNNYETWITQIPDIETIRMNPPSNNLADYALCDGLILTGGEDIDPAYYGHPEYLPFCDQTYMNPRRDQFEWKLLESWKNNPIPLLGICRGMQLINVFLGGTLIPDLPRAGYHIHSMYDKKDDRYHTLSIPPNSPLAKLVETGESQINSAHHQAVQNPGKNIKIIAFSNEGVPEALTWADPENLPWMMAVQWHPERMQPAKAPLAAGILTHFIHAIIDSKI